MGVVPVKMATQQQTVTITDNDGNGELTTSTSTIDEAAGTSTVTATLSAISFENVTVEFRLHWYGNQCAAITTRLQHVSLF